MNQQYKEMEVPVLEAEHLQLRPISEKDIAALFNLFSSEKVTRFMDIERFINVSEAAQLVVFFREKLLSGEGMRWGIFQQDNDTLIGTCGLHHINKTHYKAEMGYDLLPAFWGKGIMTASLNRLLQYAFEVLSLNRIEAVVDPANKLSILLLERLGFQQEGLLRQAFFQKGKFVDAYMFSLLSSEYNYELHY
ncbi:GNAT family N-acetyltransferase [Chitinophaga silvisoli]|uniref:N-acetyltransferase n=1 Tax=Chitinophaga silvisoli TaxID=2291814 RepID=A0A3E1NUP7_9BACT|nr:GNAT family protein [Chitinophaga silvisoli]RFM31659.1 N-acetyltransferase [Chitinophaga silvisoli]